MQVTIYFQQFTATIYIKKALFFFCEKNLNQSVTLKTNIDSFNFFC